MKSRRTRAHWALFICVAALALAADIVTKHLVVTGHWHGEFLGGILRITHVNNPGAAFGLFSGGRVIFIVIKVAALAAILYFVHSARKSEGWRFLLPLALIFSGAMGNLIDRLRGTGEVVDWLDFGMGLRRWYVFNIADACISVGAVLIVIILLLESRQKPEKELE